MGVVPKNADAGSVAHVDDAASIVGVSSKAYSHLTDAPSGRRKGGYVWKLGPISDIINRCCVTLLPI
jgi:hypothetical protein